MDGRDQVLPSVPAPAACKKNDRVRFALVASRPVVLFSRHGKETPRNTRAAPPAGPRPEEPRRNGASPSVCSPSRSACPRVGSSPTSAPRTRCRSACWIRWPGCRTHSDRARDGRAGRPAHGLRPWSATGSAGHPARFARRMPPVAAAMFELDDVESPVRDKVVEMEAE